MGTAITELIAPQKEYRLVFSPKDAQIVIDFSSPEGTKLALKTALEYSLPLVSGTTGLPEKLKLDIQEAARKIPILSSPNFSFGMALYLKMLPEIVKQIPDFSGKIVETHHQHKKDAPSGTALRLAEALGSEKKIPIESIRAGEAIGEHRIFLNLEGEILEFRHEALSRTAFAKGALMAANFLVNKPAGTYTLMDLF